MTRGTQLLLGIGATAIVVIALLLPSFASVVSMWPLSLYRYAYLIFPVSTYLLWQQRDALAAQPVRPSWLGLAVVLVLTAGLLVGRATLVQAIEHLTVMLMIAAVVWAIFGTAVFRAAAFPLLLLVAAAPIYEPVVPPLMVFTADVSEVLLRLVGQPVLRHGQIFELPGGSFHVADVCAGLRYLLAGVVTATAFAHLSFASWKKQLLFVVIAAAAFIMANALRAFLVMHIYSLTNGGIFGEGHNGFGMTLFASVMVLLLWAGLKFADPPVAPTVAPAGSQPLGFGRGSMIAAVVSVAILALVPLAQARKQRVAHAELHWPALPAIEGCEAAAQWSADWGPFMAGSDAERSGTYRCGDVLVDVFVAAYATQDPDKELVSAGNDLLPDSRTSRSRITTSAFRASDGDDVVVRELEVLGGLPEVIWTWYSVGNTPVTTGSGVKLHEALNALRFGSAPSAVYVVSVRGDPPDVEAARQWASVAAEAIWSETDAGRAGHGPE